MESTRLKILTTFILNIIFLGLLHTDAEVEERCSKYFCNNATQESNCSLLWDECLCIDSVKMKCDNLYFKPSGYDLSQVNYDYKFSLIYEDISLDKIVQFYGRKIAASGLISMVLFTKRCNSDKAIFLDTVPLDIKKFTMQSNILVLSLQRNCLKELDGIFGEYFPKLQELDVSKNSIEKLDERIFDGLLKLENLNIGYNKISNITRRIFQDLKSLMELNLCHNNIRNLTDDVFNDLVYLEQLSICNNKLLMQIPDELFIQNTMLVCLDLNGNSLQQLPENVFSTLNNLKLLNLKHNQLISLSEKLFLNLHLISSVYLSSNKLENIPESLFSTNKYLNEIDLSQNKFNYFPGMYLSTNEEVKIFLRKCNISSISVLPTTSSGKPLTLSMSNNCVQNINITSTPHRTKFSKVVCSSCCLRDVPYNLLQSIKADEIDLSYNEISKINLFNILNVVDGNVLNLNHNKILTINMSGISTKDFRRQSSVELLLENNPFNCDCNFDSLVQYFIDAKLMSETKQGRLGFKLDRDAVCDQPAKLKNKKLTDLIYPDLTCDLKNLCPSLCRCHYEAETRAVVVDCQGKGIIEIPDLKNITHSLIVHVENNNIWILPSKESDFWKRIRELYLGNNKIYSLNNVTISGELRKLYLDINKLTKFQNILLDLVSLNGVQLKLGHNPWDCCSIGVAKRYIVKNDTQIVDLDQLKCVVNKMGNAHSVLLTDATDEDLCLLSKVNDINLKISLACLAAFSLILSMVIITFYRYKVELRHWMFVRNICLNLVTEEDVDANKKYDAFVSYSYKDEEWVANVLVPGLEQGTPSYTLCLHERDWLGGEWITDQIVRSVEESRRTILVLTNNFVESHWSKLEFIAAYHQMVKDKVKRIIIVVPFDLPDLNRLDDDLRLFVSINTYIKWDQAHFWRKLRCSMPHIKRPPNTIQRQRYVGETRIL